MSTRWFRMTVHREWVIRVDDDSLNEDDVYRRSVGDFLNTDLADIVDFEQIDEDEVEEGEYENSDLQSWDYEIAKEGTE